jgi:hypothetical protein
MSLGEIHDVTESREQRHTGGDVQTGCEELDEHEEHEVFVAAGNLEA